MGLRGAPVGVASETWSMKASLFFDWRSLRLNQAAMKVDMHLANLKTYELVAYMNYDTGTY